MKINRLSLVLASHMLAFAVNLRVMQLENKSLLNWDCRWDKTSNLEMSHCSLQTCDGYCFTIF